MVDRTAFFDAVRERPFGGHLTQAAVDRLNAILAAFATYGDGDPRKLAYICATAYRESGAFKWDREIWGPTATQRRYEGRKDLGNTQPGDGHRFMGRGFVVMITGRRNYADWGKRLGADLVGSPDLAAAIDHAARIGVEGMMLGTFTGKSLADYFNDSRDDPLHARIVVNAMDHASEIAGYHRQFLAALA